MRIGIDCRLWEESGVGRYTRNLIQNLEILDKNNEYVLFSLPKNYQNIKDQISLLRQGYGGQANLKSKLEHGKWKIVEVNIRWHSVDEQIKFPQIINKEKVELMHFPYFSVPLFYNKPFVVTIHDLILDHFPTGQASTLPLPIYKLKSLGYKLVINHAVNKAKKIITVSNATKNEIIEHFNVEQDKVVVTYEGTDEKISNLKSQISNLKWKSIKSKEYLLYVGNAYPHKNLERLIIAFSQTRFVKDNPNLVCNDGDRKDIKLVLVGKEDYFYKRLKEKVKKLNLENRTIFFGYASDEELSTLYQNAIALIAPSLVEGFGLPIIEAMENKCLVICSDIPVFKEIAGDAAVYFDPLDIESISNILTKVIHYDNTYHHSDKIKEGLKRASLFSWKKMAEQTLQAYSYQDNFYKNILQF